MNSYSVRNFWMAYFLSTSSNLRSASTATHPSWRHGGGCESLHQHGDELLWDDLIEIRSLPTDSEVFVCYDGRYSSEDEQKLKQSPEAFKTDPIGGGVILVENFLTSAEIEHMKTLAEKWTANAEDEGGWKFAYGVGDQFRENFDLDDARTRHRATHAAFQDAILNNVESRIAAFLQIPATLFENYLQLMVETGSRVTAVHHDKNHALVRRATAILYLNGGARDEMLGGETLFPALARVRPTMRGPEQNRIYRKLKGIVSRTMRNLGPNDAWPEMQVVEGEPLHAELMALCKNASSEGVFGGENGEGPMLAVAPTPGRALFWWSERPYLNSTESNLSGEILPDMWHVGCPVRRGRKVALQKFKNFGPEDEMCKHLRWCREGWKRLLKSNSEL